MFHTDNSHYSAALLSSHSTMESTPGTLSRRQSGAAHPTSACFHPSRIGDGEHSNCASCGVFLPQRSYSQAFRVPAKHFQLDLPVSSFLSTFSETDAHRIIQKNVDPSALFTSAFGELPFVKHRRVLVDWICEVCDRLKL